MTVQLDRYATQRWISAAQHTAGVIFARDAALARAHFRRPPTAKPNPDEATAAARFRAECDELGPLRHPLIAVIVHNVGASTWEGHRRNDGMAMFRHALDRLLEIYARERAA